MIEEFNVPTPKQGETEFEYIPRCVKSLESNFHPYDAYEICQRFWDEKTF